MFFLLLTLFWSCTQSGKKQPAETIGGGAAEAQQTDAASGDGEEKNSSAGSGAASVSEPKGNDFLLFSEMRTEPVIAQDFELGPLQRGFGNEGITADIFSTAEVFLRGLETGEVVSSLIGSGKKSMVERMMRDGLAISVPDGFRIGEINIISVPARAGVKMYGKDGYSSGTMYFIREGGWKVYDFHFDFADLEKPVRHEPEVWDPSDRKMIEVEYGKYN